MLRIRPDGASFAYKFSISVQKGPELVTLRTKNRAL